MGTSALPRRARRGSVLAGLALLGSLAPGTAATAAAAGGRAGAASPPPPSFEESTQLVAVEVPVTVVDRDGRPLRGLRQEDFEILDEGSRQAISGFEVVDLKASAPRSAGVANVRPRPLRSSERRHFLLLFDLSFSSPVSLTRARTAARDFVLRALDPSDLAAVATVSLEHGVRLAVTFTPDRAQLARGIDTLRADESEASVALDPLRFLVVPPASSESPVAGAAGGPVDREALALDQLTTIAQRIDVSQKLFDTGRVQAFLRTLGDMARQLEVVPGRKHVVLFSEGFDSRLLLGREPGTTEEQDDAFNIAFGQNWQVDTDNRFGNTVLQGVLGRALEEFRRADCLIQAVDVGGLRNSADASGGRRRTGKDALFVMANETGGELFEDANNLVKQLERVLERNSVTYVLTFERSDVKSDGAYHRLTVRVPGAKGARVAHRAGYYAPRPFGDIHPFEKSLLAASEIASAVPRRDIGLDVLVAAFRSGGERAYVPVVIEIDGPSLTGGRSERVPVEIYAYVSDERGEMRDFFTRSVVIEAPRSATAGPAGLKYYGHVALPAGSYLLRVMVRNAESGAVGVEAVPFGVPRFDGAVAVLPPFFAEAPGRWFLLRESAADPSGDVVYPFVVDGTPFVPAVEPALAAGDALDLVLQAYGFEGPEAAVSFALRGADGNPAESGAVRGLRRSLSAAGPAAKFVATLDSTGLKPGRYWLDVQVTNPGTGKSGSASAPFIVSH